MVVVTSAETKSLLPHLTLESMTKHQLEEFIPQLVTKVTGRTSPQFGSLKDKPDWWPGNLEWTNPRELSDIYQVVSINRSYIIENGLMGGKICGLCIQVVFRQDPCEKLREIVRSGYFHMDQDSLLNSSDLTGFNAELPLSPAAEDIPSTKEVEPDKDPCKMTIQSEEPCVINLDDSMEILSDNHYVDFSNKNDDGVNMEVIEDMESENDKETEQENVVRKINEDSESDSQKEVVKEIDNVLDCAFTGMSVPTDNCTQNISQDIIAQIDEQIANSLKEAFRNMKHASYCVEERAGMRGGSPLGFEISTGLDKLTNRKKLVARRHSSDSVTDLERKMPEARNVFLKTKDTTKSKVNFSKTDKPCTQVDNLTMKTKGDEHLDLEKTPLSNAASVKDLAAAKDEKTEDDVVWICFVCAKGFPDQATLVGHQDACEDTPVLKSNDVTQPSVSTLSASVRNPLIGVPHDSVSASHHVLRAGDRNVSETEKVGKPVPTLLRKVGSNIKSLPLGLPTKSQPFKPGVRKFTDIYIPPNRDLYFESLGLVPTLKVEEISKSPRKSLTDEDCQIIDLTVEDTQQTVPLTPRTPKSLMSQLSRDDGSGRRRQLSFSSPSQAQKTQKQASEETDSSSESSTDDVITQPQKVPSKSAVLGIPLTSPLGQRLKKHWNYENKVPIVENVECFCKTDPSSIASPEVKNKKSRMVEKLRNRPPPQCTFRFTKKYMNKWFHFYKFNKADKYEFQKTLRFGLNRESRLKFKRMKQCNVALSRISPKDIKYWTTPKTQPRKFLPDTSSLKQYNRRVRQNQIQSAMFSRSPTQYVQSMAFCQMSRQVKNFGPTPQLLVRSVPMGNQGMRLQVLPIQQATFNQNATVYNTQKQILPVAQRELSGSQKRKQVFTNVRADDNMVICLSSDEEDDGKVTKCLSNAKSVIVCAACRVNKETCKTHGKKKIGPASYMLGLLNKPSPSNSHQVNVKDNKVLCPANIISPKPVSTSQQYFYANTASAKVFGNSLGPVGQTSVPNTVNGNLVKCRMAEGKVESCSTSQPHHAVEYVISQPETSLTGSVTQNDVNKAEEGTIEIGTQSTDADFMDYEVICIDSDDED